MKKCFLICPIGEEGGEIRKRSDKVLRCLIDPICKKYGYEIIRSDMEHTINKIDDDIFNHLDNDDLAIADLTGLNPNVFYEAGYRNAIKKPLIHIAEKGTELPFDVGRIRTYFYSFDIEEADEFKSALSKVIESIENSIAADNECNISLPMNSKDEELNSSEKDIIIKLYSQYDRLVNEYHTSVNEAVKFKNVYEISAITGVSLSDANYYCRQLHSKGFLKCVMSDATVLSCELTSQGILYGEKHFDDNNYRKMILDIVDKYNENGQTQVMSGQIDINEEDLDILKEDGYISLKQYVNGDCAIKPTVKALRSYKFYKKRCK